MSAKTVKDVFDRYGVKHSVKSAKRFRQSIAFGGPKVYQVIDERALPEWKKFLSNSDNKQALIRFLSSNDKHRRAVVPDKSFIKRKRRMAIHTSP